MKNCITIELRALSIIIKRKIEMCESIKETEKLTGMHAWILRYLVIQKKLGNEIYQKNMECEFSIRRSTATEMLKLMENNGLITKDDVDFDKRLKKITLTEKAIKLNDNIVAEIEKIESKMIEGVSPAELETFFTVAEKIKNNLKKIEN